MDLRQSGPTAGSISLGAFQGVLTVAFFASGASAILCQVAWQRILVLHAGMDLYSVTTVVAAYMMGLGVGNLAGGAIADRLRPAHCLLVYLAVEVVIALCAWMSPLVLYDFYGEVSTNIQGRLAGFLTQAGMLAVPTTLMGFTLPLLARGAIRVAPEIAGTVGRLYGANTLGAAAAGVAMSARWGLLGRMGIEGAVETAASLNILAALAVLVLVIARVGTPSTSADAAAEPQAAAGGSGAPRDLDRAKVAWIATYGLVGFVSLSLEIVWFRLLNVLVDSTTFTFGRLLTLFLFGLGAGSWVGGRLVMRFTRPTEAFLWVQYGVSLLGLLGPLLLVTYLGSQAVLPRDNFRWLYSGLIIVIPTFLMGIAFPLVQRVVSERLESVGRRTGALLFANTVGSFAGTVATGFFFLNWFGTPATLSGLAAIGLCFGLTAAWRSSVGRRRALVMALPIAATGLAIAAMPESDVFWEALHSKSTVAYRIGQDHDISFASFVAAEDGTCVSALGMFEQDDVPSAYVFVSGQLNNPYPFLPFHVRLGVIPALMHHSPERSLVIGLGIGSTPASVAAEPRISTIEVIEICDRLPYLLRNQLGDLPEFRRMFDDPRIRFFAADGRKHLKEAERPFDLIVTDTLRVARPCSGCLYSEEFYQIVRSKLQPDGLFAQWRASDRTEASAAQVFPYVLHITADAHERGFMVMSDQPIRFDRAILLERLAATGSAFDDASHERLAKFIRTASTRRVRWGGPVPERPPYGTNTDLFPRDEFGTRPRAWGSK